MVDVSKYLEPDAGNFDIGLFRRRLVTSCGEIASAIGRLKRSLPDEQREKLFGITVEINDAEYPRVILESCGVSITTATRHEFDDFDDLASFLINEKTVGELP